MTPSRTKRPGPVYSDEACRDIWNKTEDKAVKAVCSNALRGDLRARQQIVDMLKRGK